MGIFDYRGYGTAEAADLADLSHALAVYGQVKSIFGLPAGEIMEALGDVFHDPTDLSLPAGWSDIDPLSIGVDPSIVDLDGYIKMVSPITGTAYSGPQLTLVEQRDASGSVIGLGVVFIGTNSPVDVLDYLQLNTGELSASMEPVLELVKAYAQSLGLDGSDVLVTGYSLGAGYTNLMAEYADTLADGFFAGSDYIAHETPLIYDDNERVLNIGYENDVVFRAAGDHETFFEALAAADPLLSNPDTSYASTTDNFVIFDGSYAFADITLAVDSILNVVGSWWAHVGGVTADAIARVGESSFYEFTGRDSVVVVSNLDADLRGAVWVEDKASPTSNHFGAPSFVIGTDHGDLLGDGSGNDWIDGGKGNDRIRVSEGYNRVDGGEGYDTLRLDGRPGEYDVYRLNDGSMGFVSADGVSIAENVEDVEFTWTGPLGLIETTADYSIKWNRLEDDRWSLFQWGDQDIAYGSAAQGSAENDRLSGNVVFGHDGNDRLTGTSGADLLIGGEGMDRLKGGAGADRLYGGEDADRLIGDSNGDVLNGGHGDDVFVFTSAATGTIVVEDFNAAANEDDHLLLIGADLDAVLASARIVGDDLLLSTHGLTIRLEDVSPDDLDSGNLLIA